MSGEKTHPPAPTGKYQIVPGFHAVQEALLTGRPKILEIWIKEEKGGARVRELTGSAKEKGIPFSFMSGEEMDRLFPGIAHQGVVGLAGEFRYSRIEEVLEARRGREGEATILAADHITDEGNLGALVRTGAFFGAHGLILPKDRSASISPRLMKRSAGALVHLPVVRVVNLGRALSMLKENGLWVIGAAGESLQSIYEFDWKRDLVLVMGSEEKGLTPLIREKCDQIVRIPGSGKVESLNVSVAAGTILSEIQRQRRTEDRSASLWPSPTPAGDGG